MCTLKSRSVKGKRGYCCRMSRRQILFEKLKVLCAEDLYFAVIFERYFFNLVAIRHQRNLPQVTGSGKIRVLCNHVPEFRGKFFSSFTNMAIRTGRRQIVHPAMTTIAG